MIPCALEKMDFKIYGFNIWKNTALLKIFRRMHVTQELHSSKKVRSSVHPAAAFLCCFVDGNS